MKNRLRDWFLGLSRREQVLVSVMLALIAAVLFWLLLFLPLDSAIEEAEARHVAAVERHGRIAALVEALEGAGPVEARAVDVALDRYVAQSAADAGFTLERNALQGADRLAVTLGSARPPALMAWVADLEARGIRVESLSTRPAGPDTIAVEAVLARSAP